MRILFTRFPLSSAHGGAENQTMWLASGLRECGHEVSFLGSCPVLLDGFSKLKAQSSKLVIGPPPVTKWQAASFLWRQSAMFKALTKSIEALPEKPDVIVMLSLSEKILLTPWAAAKGMHIFWIEHDRIGNWLTKNPWLPALKKAAEHATIVCVSELSRRMYIDRGFDAARVVSIPNGVPEEVTSHKSQVRSFHLGCIARLSPEKGIDVLLQALAFVPEATLTIVGTGPEETPIQSLIADDTKRVGRERIHLRTRVNDLEEFYESIDVLVLPSKEHDPFGLVVAEAMMRGIPSVITDACGIAGYLHSGVDALIVSANDSASLGTALRRLLDPLTRSRIALAGHETAEKLFALPRMTEAYEALFRAGTSTRVVS